jgi:hypothetical protein
MGEPREWEVVETEKLQECKVFAVSRSMARSPRTGETHPFFRIEADEWVNVVPITAGGEVVMVRQYRHGSREITWVPAGSSIQERRRPRRRSAS